VGRHPEVAALVPLVARLLDDQAPQVVRAALTACTTYRSGELILPICRAGLERSLQGMALRALRAMGVRVAGPLTGMLADPRNPRELRSFAARALGRLGGSGATAGLIAGLVADDRKVRGATLKALNYMRRRGEKPSIGRREEAAVIRIEWLDYLALHRLAAALETSASETPTAFVATVVDERLHEAEERLFRALGLRHPIQAVFFAYRGLGTGEPRARAHAIELIDSIVETPERRTLVRLLEAEGRRAKGRIAAAELGRAIPEPEAALVELLDPGDPWLAACAIHALGRGRLAVISRGLRMDLLAHGYGPLDELLGGDAS
jgi:HEAT repeat protein